MDSREEYTPDGTHGNTPLTLAKAVRTLLKRGAVVAGCPPGLKSPLTTRSRGEGGSASWDVHKAEGHLAKGVDHLLAGTPGWGAYVPPGGVPMLDGHLACADVDLGASSVAGLLAVMPYSLLEYRKPSDPGRAHVWYLLEERIGSVELFVYGLKIGEWRAASKDGRSIGVGMRLYEGEAEALVNALQTGELVQNRIPAAVRPYPWSKAVKRAIGKLETLMKGSRNPSLMEILRPLEPWVGQRGDFEPALARAYGSRFTDDEGRSPVEEISHALDTVATTPHPGGGRRRPKVEEAVPEAAALPPLMPAARRREPDLGSPPEDTKWVHTPRELAGSFAVHHAPNHYCCNRRWYVWKDGYGWLEDGSMSSPPFLLDAMARHAESRYCTRGEDGKLAPDSVAGGRVRLHKDAIELLPPLKLMSIEPAAFDSDPCLVGMPGAQCLDLRSAEVRPLKRKDLVTLYTPVSVVHEWEEAFIGRLLRAMLPDEQTREWLLRALGSMLWGVPMLRILLFMPGVTGAGKTLLLELLKAALGPLAGTMAASTFTTRARGFDVDNANALLRGVRLATISEIAANQVLDPVRVNSATGNDTLISRRIGENQVATLASHSILFAMNDLPKVDVESSPEAARAFFDRARVVRSPHRLSADMGREGYQHAMKDPAELGAVLGMLHAGAMRFRESGEAPISPFMRAAASEWWDELAEGGDPS